MINKHPLLYLTVLVLGIAMVAVMVHPLTAFADAETPGGTEQPLDTAPVQAGPPEVVPPNTQAVIEAPAVVETTVEEQPVEEVATGTDPVTVEDPAATTEESQTVVEEQAPVDTQETTEQTVAETGTVVADPVVQAAAPVDSAALAIDTSSETVAEVIPAETATEEVVDTSSTCETDLASSPDPYIDRADGRYRFLYTGGCALYGGISAYCKESTNPIQSAVNAALNGETIYVEAGTYTEQVQVLNMSLTLQGVGSPTIAAPSTLSATGSGFAIIYANNSNLTIDGFVINGSTATDGDALTDNSIFGIYYVNSSGSITNNTIINNNATDDYTYGIYVNNADGTVRKVVVDNNDIVNYTDGGIYTRGTNLTSDITNNVITNTAAPVDWSAAIRTDYTAGSNISDNTITGKHFQGIDVRFSDSNTISGNNITATHYGISLVDSDTNLIKLNIITEVDADAASAAVSLDFDSDDNTVAQNDLDNNNIAVSIKNNSDYNDITNNHITNNIYGVTQAAELGWDAPYSTEVFNNVITGNTVAINNTTTNSIIATYNWWGCKDGPPTCGTVVGLVDTSNPLAANPDPDDDLYFGTADNCPLVYNPEQTDTDGDKIGDACDTIEYYSQEIVYKVYANFDPEKEMLTYAAPLTWSNPSAFELVDTQADGSEVELAKVSYALGIAPEGAVATFKQVLESDLPKPLNEDTKYLGPAFTLTANVPDGAELSNLYMNMDLRWKLPQDYTAPEGYKLAIHYFDNKSSYWVTEEWDDIDVEVVDGYVYAHDTRLGSYVLTLVKK